LFLGPESALASVSADDVRDVINVSSAEVPDVKVLKMVKRAEVTLELGLFEKSTGAIVRMHRRM
jgi:hypothetical protein